jgi:hypothetical protein
LFFGKVELNGPILQHGPADGKGERRRHEPDEAPEEQPTRRLGRFRHQCLAEKDATAPEK